MSPSRAGVPFRWAFLRDSTVSLAVVLSIVAAGFGIFLDIETWLQLNVSVLYTIPLVLAAPARSRRLLWGLATSLVSVTFLVYSWQIAPGAFSWHEPYFVNRVLAAVTVLLTAALLHAWIRTVDAFDAQGELLKERNAQLEATNRELAARERQIALQNEELERRRRTAEEASSRKSRLLASVSHDIRTPVHAINLLAQVIRRTAEDPHLASEVPAMAKRLQSNALSLADLLADVLDIARIDAGHTQPRPTVFSLNELVFEQCHNLAPLASARGLDFEAQTPPAALRLSADRVMLARVIANLVANAVKFTDKGGVVVRAMRGVGGEALVQVRDTGIGIPDEQLGCIFDEFTRIHSTSGQGWGLGLAICRRLVDALGGSITAESRPGVGSTFTVRLPAACVVEPLDAASPTGHESRVAPDPPARPLRGPAAPGLDHGAA